MKRLSFFILILLCISFDSDAATFQYIFNNIEQGAGGTSNPSIVVDGNKAVKRPDAVPVPINDNSPTQDVTSNTSVAQENFSSQIPYRFRLMALGNYTNLSSKQDSSWAAAKRDMHQLGWDNHSQATPALAGSIFIDRDVALTAFWALKKQQSRTSTYGGELDFTPIRVAVLGNTDFIEIAALLGASNLGHEELNKAGTLHAGGRVNVNFHRKLGITSAVRTNLSDRNTFRYSMAEAGLTYKF